MKEKIVIFDIDDIHPEEGFGLNKEKGPLNFIKKLNKTFGLKATIFVPLNWHEKFSLQKNKEWTDWLRRFQNYGHEIGAHGYTHNHTDERLGSQEFLMYNDKDTDKVLYTIKESWLKLGIDVQGIRYPGWAETKWTEKHSSKYFKYIATHMVGEASVIGFNGIYKTPYNLNINNLYDVGQNVFILHAHIGTNIKTKNLLTLKTYLKIVDFILELEKKYKITYMTHGEYVQWLKQKKI